MGRYILSPSIFGHLKGLKPGKGGEYQLTDAIASMLETEQVYGTVYKGVRLDCGVREGWIRATVAKALEDPALRGIVLDVVKESGLIK